MLYIFNLIHLLVLASSQDSLEQTNRSAIPKKTALSSTTTTKGGCKNYILLLKETYTIIAKKALKSGTESTSTANVNDDNIEDLTMSPEEADILLGEMGIPVRILLIDLFVLIKLHNSNNYCHIYRHGMVK